MCNFFCPEYLTESKHSINHTPHLCIPTLIGFVSLQEIVGHVGSLNSHTELELLSSHVVPLNREAAEKIIIVATCQ